MTFGVNTCELVVGRLLEIRVAVGYRTVADVDAMIAMIAAKIAEVPAHSKVAIVADWRPVGVMPPETAARAREMLARGNPRASRAAIWTLPEHPVQNLQVIRLVREAENRERRHFVDAHVLHEWMLPALTTAEAVRLETFLAGP